MNFVIVSVVKQTFGLVEASLKTLARKLKDYFATLAMTTIYSLSIRNNNQGISNI